MVFRLTATAISLFLINSFIVLTMELVSPDILEHQILKNAAYTLTTYTFKEAVGEKSSKMPDLFYVPRVLQKACSLRLVNKRWRSLLTVPKILEYTAVNSIDIAGWQVLYAADQNRVLQRLIKQSQDLKNKGDVSTPQSFDLAIKEVIERPFVTMNVLLRRNIVDSNVCIPVVSTADPENSASMSIPILHLALYFKAHYKFIELLLFAGANVNYDVPSHKFRTPLYTGMTYNKEDALTNALLLVAGGGKNSVYKGYSLLDSAVSNPFVTDDDERARIIDELRVWCNITDYLSVFNKVFTSICCAIVKCPTSVIEIVYRKKQKQWVLDTEKYRSELSDNNI